ncbi:OprD family porin [Pseudomonas kurunegalensis]|uniref:OprD family porin n=1 Tax=Pseudomonas kurunegalensis TaxID=485880 RepID=UPI00256FD504|nr:OprD family porin [Pseudomonas kurunegalensis]WJD65115.1 OprD family porin [Pseudomonas kurunegalensis]
MTEKLVSAALLALPVISFSLPSCASFLEGSHAGVELRNFYINKDFRQSSAAQNKAEEWAQSMILRFNSGFTPGTIGFGVDALVLTGLKLDSSPDRRGTGLLPYDESGRPEDTFTELGITGKFRTSKTELLIGTLQPKLPVINFSDSRMLPSTYTGTMLSSKELDHFTLNAGRIEKENLRDSTSNDDLLYAKVGASHLDFLGGAYAPNPDLSLAYYASQLDNIYRQQFAGLVHTYRLTDSISLKSDLRLFHSTDYGDKNLTSNSRVDQGEINNNFFSAFETLSWGAHKYTIGYQNLSGDGDFPYLGVVPYSNNLSLIGAFTKADTDAVQYRYDYDFAGLGIPGLTLMARYVKAKHVRTAAVSSGTESERNMDLSYVVQSGPLKNLSLAWRYGSFRSGSGLTNNIDENRLVLGYTLNLW